MNIKKLLPILSAALLLSGCGNAASDTDAGNVSPAASSDISASSDASVSNDISDEQAQVPEESSSTESTPSEEPSERASESSELSSSELDEFTTLFDTPEYKGFLAEPFNSPDDINWDSVFYYGAGIDVKDVSDDEIADYLAASDQPQVYGDLFVIRASALQEYLSSHLRINAPAKLPSSYWTYVQSRDSYYYYHWSSDMDDRKYTCISGEKTGNDYTLRFRWENEKNYGKYADRVIKLTQDGDSFVMESNSIQWDDHCDPDQTFDITLSEEFGPIHFITYLPEVDEGMKIIMVKDGKFLTNVSTDIWKGSESTSLQKIKAVSFFDFNADGTKDILVIGEADSRDHVILEESVPNGYYYETCYNISNKLDEELGNEITVSAVKSFLLGDNTECKFDNYKDAYAHMARLFNMSSEDFVYGLIDCNGDDIPELVIDHQGYGVSLYTFEKDHLHCLMYDWAYGAMGNAGYEYSPGKGVFFNCNSDYAGAIQYYSYMTIHEGTELVSDYCVEYLFFKDTDGDRVPSEEELAATDEMDVYDAHYYNYTDKEMSEDELKALIAELDNYPKETVGGDMSYNDFINSLK